MEINLIIAENLKNLRKERNLSLGQLAERSEISKTMLSQIEKGETNPTINTLWKLCSGLNVPYTSLLEQVKFNTQVVSKKDSTCQASTDKSYRIYCFYPNTPQRNFELFQLELDQGKQYISNGHSEKSEEYLPVLEGELTLELKNECILLTSDEATTFNATEKHSYKNTGKEMIKAIVINYYPQ